MPKEYVLVRILDIIHDRNCFKTSFSLAAATRANDQGGIIEKDLPIHVSNVMYVHKGNTVRLGYKTLDDGTKVRVARPSGEEI